MRLRKVLFTTLSAIVFFSCKKDNSKGDVKINFIFKFDSTQARLNGTGQPATMPVGHSGQSPRFNLMSAHYLELAPSATTLLGAGQVLYRAPETSAGGSNAIDFSKSSFAGDGKVFLSVPIKNFNAGTYNWLRLSLAYQNYNVYINAAGFSVDATVASFIGFNTYLTNYKIKDSTVTINGNKLQGYWAIEGSAAGLGFVRTGQAPPGATTVPNPLFATSPVPAGSCVVTGQFATPLVITGSEENDINVIVSLSTNKSFEWIDGNGNGLYEPLLGEQVVDMGIRGMIPKQQ
jgi:hypothetical protein